MALRATSATWESRGPHGSEGLGADRGGAEGGCIRAEEQRVSSAFAQCAAKAGVRGRRRYILCISPRRSVWSVIKLCVSGRHRCCRALYRQPWCGACLRKVCARGRTLSRDARSRGAQIPGCSIQFRVPAALENALRRSKVSRPSACGLHLSTHVIIHT